jgi:hypothetical protein
MPDIVGVLSLTADSSPKSGRGVILSECAFQSESLDDLLDDIAWWRREGLDGGGIDRLEATVPLSRAASENFPFRPERACGEAAERRCEVVVLFDRTESEDVVLDRGSMFEAMSDSIARFEAITISSRNGKCH